MILRSSTTWTAVLVVVVLLLMGTPLGTGSHVRSPTANGVVLSPGAHGEPAGPAPQTSAPPLGCLSIPRGPACYGAGDQPVVDLISNSSGSGSRFSLAISLPPSGTNPASAVASFWVGLWVSGAPCSVDSASYLRVELYPPFSPAVAPASPNWTVRAPVEDLVPSGSCDPLCQNATAVATLGGVPVCEDNIVVGGGWPASSSVGRFAPGDQLRVTAWGTVGGPTPLAVWANDSTHPSESASWQYGAGATTTGQPVTPRFVVSNSSDGGWSTPYDVAFGWNACPALPGFGACNSYDGPAVGAVGLPTVTGTEFWNASSSAMEAYGWLATASSSGACSDGPLLPACSDFANFGGTGTYPTLQSVRTGTGVAWRIGGSANVFDPYGGAPGEFDSSGGTTLQLPSRVVVDSTNGSAGAATVNVTVADPRGVAAVRASTFWCTGAGLAVVQAQQAAGPTAGTFANLSVTLNVSSENGPLTYWISERSNGSSWTPGISYGLTMGGGAGTCTVPAPGAPGFGASNVTPVAGGYRLVWAESSAGIRGFTVTATPVGGGSTVVVPLGDVGATTLLGLVPGTHYNLTVSARSLSGATNSTTYQPPATPLTALVVVPIGPAGPTWHGAVPTRLGLRIFAGLPPFQIEVALGNGTVLISNTSANSTSVPVALGAAVGVVVLRVTVVDADGVVATATPLAPVVWAGPLGPLAKVTAGDRVVGVSWNPSVSPAAPVDHYAVYLTANASGARAAYLAGRANTSAGSPLGAIELWNTTNNSVSVPWSDNSTSYVLVVPVNSFGDGFATPAPLAATPNPILPSTIVSGPGGPAPYTTQYSTHVTTGTNDTIDEAIYSFPGFRFVNANLTRVDATDLWLNVTATVSTLGLDVVVLHVGDAFGATAIQSANVWVTAGAAPAVTALANPAPAYVGVAVQFRAAATGTGPFVYDWSFGDGTNGTGATASHSYATAGTFTATVVVTDNGTGASGTTVVPETILALPRVAIVTEAGPNGSDSFAFHAVLTGGSGVGTYVWAFGDGEVARGENVTHDYRSPGQVIVNVTATDASLRTAFANVSLSVPLVGGSASASGVQLTPLAEAALIAAVAGWVLAIALWWRERRRVRAAEDDDEDEFDEE
jgi:PKD domain-containing protein